MLADLLLDFSCCLCDLLQMCILPFCVNAWRSVVWVYVNGCRSVMSVFVNVFRSHMGVSAFGL